MNQWDKKFQKSLNHQNGMISDVVTVLERTRGRQMSIGVKINFLMTLGDVNTLTSRHLNDVVKLSSDKDEFVRSQVAVALAYFDDRIAQETLMRLACDDDSLVRTEAYDSLSIHENEEVLQFLEKSIEIENDDIACSYAIMSWTDIVIALDKNVAERRAWILQLTNVKKVYRLEHSMLSCYRAQYLLGNRNVMKEIIECLESKDYHIRCSVIGVFEDIIDSGNVKIVKDAVESLLKYEKTKAVRSRIENFLENINI